jgi:adenylosuccinate synthase
MAHTIKMIMDFQYGSTGKGLIAGYLAKRGSYDTAVCAFSANAGHTYIDESRSLNVMTQQLPTAITSPTVKTILIGPGAAIDGATLLAEIDRYADLLKDKRILIHPQAAVIEPYHAKFEIEDGRTKMGSTAKGVGEAYIERMRRKPGANTARVRWLEREMATADERELSRYVTNEEEYRQAVEASESMIVEGAQGFSLSLYHGQYPFVTSRDVTPWQIMADCALPFKMAPYVKVLGTLRTYPIRVNNRDGSSGPCYPDQREIGWGELNVPPELTTVTKLPRRIFTFSQRQLDEALYHCGGYWETELFLNFCNYMEHADDLNGLIREIESPNPSRLNAPRIAYLGYGPDDSNVHAR